MSLNKRAIFDQLTYDILLATLKQIRLKKTMFSHIIVKKHYFMIQLRSNRNVHLSIFMDQWNMYETNTKIPGKLIHISHDDHGVKQSVYFLFTDDLRVRPLTDAEFQYQQPTFGFKSSTRVKYTDKLVDVIVRQFGRVMRQVVEIVQHADNKINQSSNTGGARSYKIKYKYLSHYATI
ncbi:MAG: hypothetical protein Faunusvirus3_25 [Faunusvirus sp.]|jgi:hypothetical protein|uniref:Uncharacterized protein n=1 Tax=Faunusvirus sp. TaxID=2487766 RepID=A0A3G4ZW80_9VIRU|nr:MAG: hypothetical protein Faunusvirus3_25 [Faunusvirus sp.]